MGQVIAAIGGFLALVALLVTIFGGWDDASRQFDKTVGDIHRLIFGAPATPSNGLTPGGVVTVHNNLAVPVSVWIDDKDNGVVEASTTRQLRVDQGEHVVRWKSVQPSLNGALLGVALSGEASGADAGTDIETSAVVGGTQAYSPVVTNDLQVDCAVTIASPLEPTEVHIITMPGDKARSLGYYDLYATSFVLVHCPDSNLLLGSAPGLIGVYPISVDAVSGTLDVSLSKSGLSSQ